MPRDDFNDLLAFIAVGRERSFTRAAARLGVSPSALSHKIRGLETRMGVRLLTRTTRSVVPTEAGERLMSTVEPQFEAIKAELEGLSEFRDTPAGTVRITAVDTVADLVIWPRIAPLLLQYPDIKIEIDTGYRLANIVEERYDIGVRSGEAIAKDMVSVRMTPDFRRVIVGAPAYFAEHPVPQTPHDLLQHNCITLRLATRGGLFAWPLVRKGQTERVQVKGQVTLNGSYQILQAALDGCGLAFTPEYLARPHVEAGRLRYVMEDWFPTSSGFHMYYPSRRQKTRAMQLVIDALRWRGGSA
ncbi:LysR family transcriptional regulator [Variovorax defluvii]|uniref:LysR family transcriptional regulator n=1 Tax=Variovorax defluvii TaxID=913761 RepID=A0ABP8HXU0_9BURK